MKLKIDPEIKMLANIIGGVTGVAFALVFLSAIGQGEDPFAVVLSQLIFCLRLGIVIAFGLLSGAVGIFLVHMGFFVAAKVTKRFPAHWFDEPYIAYDRAVDFDKPITPPILEEPKYTPLEPSPPPAPRSYHRKSKR